MNVITASSLPAAVVENQIVVITDTPAGTIYVDTNEPANPVSGDVWVKVAEGQHSIRLSEESPYLDIAVTEGFQHDGNAWNSVTAYIGKNNEWKWTNPRLPAEYQEVAYIEGMGSQYIDTGFVLQRSDKVLFEFVADFPLQDAAFQGADAYLQFKVDKVGAGISDSLSGTVGTKKKYSMEYYDSIVKLYVDGTLVETRDFSSFNGKDVKVGIFRLGELNNTWFASAAILKGKVSEYRLIINDELKTHCVACYRKSNREAGAYDIVNDVLRVNAGSGTFTVGPDVLSPTEEQLQIIDILTGEVD